MKINRQNETDGNEIHGKVETNGQGVTEHFNTTGKEDSEIWKWHMCYRTNEALYFALFRVFVGLFVPYLESV